MNDFQGFFNNIKINLGYDDILVYDKFGNPAHVKSNLANYEIHPWWTPYHKKNENPPLVEIENKFGIKFPYIREGNEPNELCEVFNQLNSDDLSLILDNSFKNFEVNKVDYYLEKNISFIYPVILYADELFTKYRTMHLSENLKICLEKKLAKILFYQPTEGFIGRSNDEFIWIANFSKENNLEKNDIILITSNLKLKENYEAAVFNNIVEDRMVVSSYSYFSNSIWFHLWPFKLSEVAQVDLKRNFEEMLKSKGEKKQYHFLCFNRIPKLHRLVLFAELHLNKEFENKFITTLAYADNFYGGRAGEIDLPIEPRFHNAIKYWFADSYKHGKHRLLDFYENYDDSKHAIYDCEDLQNNKANVLNIDAQKKCFVNIVTESLTDSTTIFFSEKTFKPMYCLQPFLIVGNPQSLKKLKEMGYKTFDRWWDESYDDEINLESRIGKIIDVMKEIASWSLDECENKLNEMHEILVHNYNVLSSHEELLNLYKFLEYCQNDRIDLRDTIKRKLI